MAKTLQSRKTCLHFVCKTHKRGFVNIDIPSFVCLMDVSTYEERPLVKCDKPAIGQRPQEESGKNSFQFPVCCLIPSKNCSCNCLAS